MVTYAADFESYYDSECSIATLGPRSYFAHPDFDAYMVTVVGSDGYRYAGHPKDFDWSKFDGQHVVSHNASFDEALYLFGVAQGWYPKVDPAFWDCTADMAAYLRMPRSLAGACYAAYGDEVDKSTRKNMKGKRAAEFTDEFRAEVTEYAIEDSVQCLRLWQDYGDQWPEREREISRHTRKMIYRGLPIDRDRLDHGIAATGQVLFDFQTAIPWGERAALLSRKEFNKQCGKDGLAPPESLDAKSPDAQKFYSDNATAFPWLVAYRDLRRVNALHKKLKSLREGMGDDSRYYGGMKYAGGHTLRWSGGGGSLNLQNLPKKEMFGANLRGMIRPRTGKTLVVVDLSQIEIRTALWLAGDFEALRVIDDVGDVYEALAIMFGLHERGETPLAKSDPKLRNQCKVVGLGIQYGASAGKVAQIAGITVTEATRWVRLFQKHFPKTVTLWKRLDQLLRVSARTKEDLVFGLPSGNELRYRGMRNSASGIVCEQVRNGKPVMSRLWFGMIIENLSQSLARDVFADHLLAVEQAWPGATILHVHDEVVMEVAEEDAERCLQEVIQLMSTSPEWIPDIALNAEGTVLAEYGKA